MRPSLASASRAAFRSAAPRARIATFAPDSAKRRATAIPMPLLPPVTTATRSFIDRFIVVLPGPAACEARGRENVSKRNGDQLGRAGRVRHDNAEGLLSTPYYLARPSVTNCPTTCLRGVRTAI